MVTITALWLSILLAAVLVFIASALLHMVLPIHHRDFGPMPGEATLMAAMRKEGVRPGDYVFPHAPSPADRASPEMVEKCKEGPIGFVTILPSGVPKMGGQLTQWFVYVVVVGVLVAYVTGRTVAPTAEYLQIFRVSGTVAFLAYAAGEPVMSIWYRRKWSTTLKNMFDGLIYSLLTAGAFAGFWPG